MAVAEWEPVKLGDVSRVQRGVAYTAADIVPPGRPFVTLKCFERGGGFRLDGLKTFRGRASAEFELRGGELLVANTDVTRDAAIVGAAAIAPAFDGQAAVFSMDTSRLLTDPSKVDNRYLAARLALADARRFMQARAPGTTVLHLQISEVPRFALRLPPLPEQRRIAEILDTLDEAIRKTEQLISKLKQVKRGLLHDLLTRGIDDSGELRDPEGHPEQFKETVLGRIPKEWEVGPLETMGELSTGRTPPATDPGAWGHALPFVTPGDVNEETLLGDTERHVSERGRKYLRVLPPGTIVVTCIGILGKVGVAPWECATNQQLNALVCRNAHDPLFVSAAIRFHSRQLHRAAGLQVVPIVNKTQFGRMLVPVAPRDEQRRIAERTSSLEQRVAAEAANVRKLRLLKQGLMEDLLTGHVRVTALTNEVAA